MQLMFVYVLATTTTKPLSAQEANIAEVFANLLMDGSIETAKSAYSEQLNMLGLDTSRVDQLMGALADLKSVIVQNPSKNESLMISTKMLKFHKEAISFVQSQAGLNIENDPDIILDENFAEYNDWRLQLRHDLDCYTNDPLRSFEYIETIPEKYGRFTVLVADASKAAKLKKASTSKKI